VSDYISEEVKARVRQQAGNQCGYCRSLQKYVWGTLEIEHTIPRSKGGGNEEENLWLACRPCNTYKSAQTEAIDPLTGRTFGLYNPRKQRWTEHFAWSDDGIYVLGLTACGRATVSALQLNNSFALTVRRSWVSVGWHPPEEEG
jgi:hypothetical protein